VGLGQSWYREQAGFTLKVGDEVVVTASTRVASSRPARSRIRRPVDVVLRDETGRPLWAGRGMQRYQ
jgi:hypothetical protein